MRICLRALLFKPINKFFWWLSLHIQVLGIGWDAQKVSSYISARFDLLSGTGSKMYLINRVYTHSTILHAHHPINIWVLVVQIWYEIMVLGFQFKNMLPNVVCVIQILIICVNLLTFAGFNILNSCFTNISSFLWSILPFCFDFIVKHLYKFNDNWVFELMFVDNKWLRIKRYSLAQAFITPNLVHLI